MVSIDHQYRKFKEVFDFKFADNILAKLKKDSNYTGYGIERLFKCLLLQFMEDLSDRELMRYLADSTAAKWFCEFDILERTPDYSVFSKLRAKIGTSMLSKIFAEFRSQLKSKGYISEVFTFVDASHLISKASLWEERDKAIARKYDKLNNDTLPKVSRDKEARIGCKGKDKYWYGYKKHTSVDMQSGMINKTAITQANITDSSGLERVCPDGGVVYADKGYCGSKCELTAKHRSCEMRAVKRNNMIGKNKGLDSFITKIRAPYERVFSKQNHRVRYVGLVKNQFTAFMEAMCFNIRRMVVLNSPPTIA